MKDWIKNFINGIVEASGEQWLGFIGLSTISCLLLFALTAMLADHTPTCHYLKSYATGDGLSYRIMVNIEWAEDGKAFSSQNLTETLEVYETLGKCSEEK